MICRLRMMLVCALLLGAAPASAHLLAPALLQLEETAPQEFSVLWRSSALSDRARAVQVLLPPNCLASQPPQTQLAPGNAWVARWQVRCADGLDGQHIAARGLEDSGLNVIVRLRFRSGAQARTLLDARHASWVVSAADGTPGAVFRGYLQLGITHLWTGLDHLLFLLGLLLLVRQLRPRVLTVTAFTLGHSLTLSLACLELIQVRQVIAELLIALSIMVLALELLRPAAQPPTLLARKPWLMALLFGLVHGLGFAGALAETGLPQNEIPLSLLAFNLGIEAGQLMLIAAALALAALWQRVAPAAVSEAQAARMLPPYAMGSLAAFWCFERTAALLG